MLTLCRLLFSSLLSLVRSRAALQAEILALRHQLQVSNAPPAVASFACELPTGSSGLVVSPMDGLALLRPNRSTTVISWNRKGFRLYWTWKSRVRQGRPCKPREVRDLIRKNQLD